MGFEGQVAYTGYRCYLCQNSGAIGFSSLRFRFADQATTVHVYIAWIWFAFRSTTPILPNWRTTLHYSDANSVEHVYSYIYGYLSLFYITFTRLTLGYGDPPSDIPPSTLCDLNKPWLQNPGMLTSSAEPPRAQDIHRRSRFGLSCLLQGPVPEPYGFECL